MSDSLRPMDYTVPGILQARILEGVPFPSSGDLPNPGIEPRSPALQVDSLPSEPQGKPKNTGVGSLSLHQKIFPTQESNWSPLHCRQILYQLSYEGSHNMEREGGSGNILYRALVMIHEVEQFHMKVNGAYLKIYGITKDSFFQVVLKTQISDGKQGNSRYSLPLT